MENNQEHLFEDPSYQLVHASHGKRLANYLIDIIFFTILAVIVNMVILLNDPEKLAAAQRREPEYNLLENLVVLGIMVLYWFAMEALFKGKTLGKLITGTRAVNQDGSNLTPRTAFIRGLCRAVPFEAFSALGDPCYPWHDRWSKSYVIDERKSNRPVA